MSAEAGSPSSDGTHRLAALIGDSASRGLSATLAARNQQASVTVPEWTAEGYTGVTLVAVSIEPLAGHRGRPHKCVIKICPPGPYARESGRHYDALATAPPGFADAHLVRMAFDPIVCADGTVIIGQEVAGGSLARVRAVSQLTGQQLTGACAAVVRSLLHEWTGDDFAMSRPQTVAHLLRTELRDPFGPGGWLRSWADTRGLLGPQAWISTPEDGILPNPIFMAEPHAPSGLRAIAYLVGKTHGDLHGGNVLVPANPDGTVRPHEFRLIDLATFEAAAPLSRDPAMLLLSIAARFAGGAGPRQQDALIRYLASLDADAVYELPPSLKDQIDAVRDAADSPFVRAGWQDEWETQLLVSMQAAALIHSTFENLPVRGRWWCVRLAAHVARRLTDESAPVDGSALPLDMSVLEGPRKPTVPRQQPATVVPPTPARSARAAPRRDDTELVAALLGSLAFNGESARLLTFDLLEQEFGEQPPIRRHPFLRHEVIELVRHYAASPDELRRFIDVVCMADPRPATARTLRRLLDGGTAGDAVDE